MLGLFLVSAARISFYDSISVPGCENQPPNNPRIPRIDNHQTQLRNSKGDYQ
jgi:hypothetical protein